MTKKRSSKEGGCGQEPPIEPSPPYDELNHEILNNRLTVRVPKKVGKIVPAGGIEGPIVPNIHATCCSTEGGQCRTGCAKINLFPNETPPPKKPEEEQTLVRTTRKILNADEMRNTLEVEFRTARNYVPLPPNESYEFDPQAAAAMLVANAKKRKQERRDSKKKNKGKKK